MNLLEKHNIPNDTVITVAGMVGVGKSTMTRAIAESLGFNISLEKVDKNPYLDKFYRDFDRWSFHLQIYFLAERFKEQKRIYELGGGFVQDRSIYEDTEIFAKMHHDMGRMTKIDYETYTNLFKAMVMTPYFSHPDLLIYIEGDLENIVERIQHRGRPQEQQTPTSYWEELYQRYQNWIKNFYTCPVLHLNLKDYDIFNDPNSVKWILQRIGKKVNEKHNLHTNKQD